MEQQLLQVTWRSLAGRMFVALWGGLATVDVARPAGGTVTTVLVVALVAACGVGQSAAGALALALTGWLVINGFVLHRYGVLGFGEASRWALLLVVLVALVAALGSARQAGPR